MKLKALIVDDEPLARVRVRMMLSEEQDSEVIGECGSGAEALVAIHKDSPDLLFLDVQMPGMDGFSVLRAIAPVSRAAVVFVTAYDRHALRAFDAHALDYLLKPFKPARFKEALQRARTHIANNDAGATARGLLDLLNQQKPRTQFLTRLTFKTKEKMVILKTSEVEMIESAGNYVAVHAGKESHILRETLNALEKQLDPDRFMRVSRSALVNIDFIKELQPMFRGQHLVVLRNGKQIPMTRGLREVEKALRFSS